MHAWARRLLFLGAILIAHDNPASAQWAPGKTARIIVPFPHI